MWQTGKALYSLKVESPPLALDIARDSSAYAFGTNDGSVVVRTYQQPMEHEAEDSSKLLVNTEVPPPQKGKSYRYFYRGAYVKAKEDEVKVTSHRRPR
jgi:hypothetical protein